MDARLRPDGPSLTLDLCVLQTVSRYEQGSGHNLEDCVTVTLELTGPTTENRPEGGRLITAIPHHHNLSRFDRGPVPCKGECSRSL